jgi:hypothetical protein
VQRIGEPEDSERREPADPAERWDVMLQRKPCEPLARRCPFPGLEQIRDREHRQRRVRLERYARRDEVHRSKYGRELRSPVRRTTTYGVVREPRRRCASRQLQDQRSGIGAQASVKAVIQRYSSTRINIIMLVY